MMYGLLTENEDHPPVPWRVTRLLAPADLNRFLKRLWG